VSMQSIGPGWEFIQVQLKKMFQLRAWKTGQPTRKERAFVKHNEAIVEVSIEVVPFKVPTSDVTWALVIFSKPLFEPDTLASVRRKKRGKAKSGRQHLVVEQLRDELSSTKESLQAIIEEQEATNEELKSANEEIESSNEELQSTNEELETAKEELQSTNEELMTLNEELSNRNFEIMQINSDLINVLSSIHLPIVMLDNSLTIRRATPTARETLSINESDIGRRITDLRSNVQIPDLEKIVRNVIDSLSVDEREVQDKQGHWYSLRIRPYRTTDNKIDEAVLTLVDIAGKTDPEKSAK
jgi:two-component system, chemotaxis family, CheB/CheR fusion protein